MYLNTDNGFVNQHKKRDSNIHKYVKWIDLTDPAYT